MESSDDDYSYIHMSDLDLSSVKSKDEDKSEYYNMCEQLILDPCEVSRCISSMCEVYYLLSSVYSPFQILTSRGHNVRLSACLILAKKQDLLLYVNSQALCEVPHVVNKMDSHRDLSPPRHSVHSGSLSARYDKQLTRTQQYYLEIIKLR